MKGNAEFRPATQSARRKLQQIRSAPPRDKRFTPRKIFRPSAFIAADSQAVNFKHIEQGAHRLLTPSDYSFLDWADRAHERAIGVLNF
jgi:hypothetical protein